MNLNSSGTVTAPAPGNTMQINGCAFAGDYSTINGITASASYTFTSTGSNDFFTLRSGSQAGSVVAFGKTPLTWTATAGGTYFLHVNLNSNCLSESVCRTTTITNNGICTPPAITVTPANTCGGYVNGGPCSPLTASGADNYTWYPYVGLYTDCSMTIPYNGQNTSVVYPAPSFYTFYTVTGVNATTNCSSTATATVNLRPSTPVVNPAVVNKCLSDPPVRLTNVNQTNTLVQFCSGPVDIQVPDNDPSGVFNSITVAGIPAGATIIGLSVTINMTHTRVGNMVFALKAPNGNVLNLDYFLTGTGGQGATSGFFSTIISSAGTTALSAGFNPYTGTFRPDAFAGPAGAPLGWTPTTTTWFSLHSIYNGTWVLGMCDGVTFDTGILNSWCLNIFYSSVTPGYLTTRAVWTPAAGLFFDQAATIPYIAGTPVDTVYAGPNPAGVYNYQVTTQGQQPPNTITCTSSPRNVVVNVSMPAVINTQPMNQVICLGQSALFSVSASSSTGLTYQWQVSTNGGLNYLNLANGAPYSGVTTASLSITAPPINMSSYRYRAIINGGGNCGAISLPATLTVNPLPVVIIAANPTIVLPGRPTTIHSSVTPNPGATYTWYHNGSVVVGATEDSLVVDINGLGDYQLHVVDINGCAALSNIITITDQLTSKLFVYPNPSNGVFQARYYNEPNANSPRSLIIYNNRGEKVVNRSFIQSISYQRIDIDLRPYGRGLYWIMLFDQNGKRIAMNRIAVQ